MKSFPPCLESCSFINYQDLKAMNIAVIKPLHAAIRKDVLACVVTGLVFFSLPEIDIWVSKQFYDGGVFYLRENTLLSLIHI